MLAADADEAYDFLFKIVLIGDAGVGKTCVVQRFKSGIFVERQGNTIGVDFTMKTVDIQGKRVKDKLLTCLIAWFAYSSFLFFVVANLGYCWTGAVSHHYSELPLKALMGQSLHTYISKSSSFHSVPRWIEDVRRYAGSNIVQLLIEVPFDEAEALARQHEAIDAIETPAKDASNVETAFTKMATELMVRHGGPVFTDAGVDTIKLNSKDVGDSWSCGC
ncbi:RAB43 protein, partial [Polypterus senegalus]